MMIIFRLTNLSPTKAPIIFGCVFVASLWPVRLNPGVRINSLRNKSPEIARVESAGHCPDGAFIPRGQLRAVKTREELNVVDVKSGGQHQRIRLTVQNLSSDRIVGQFQAGLDQPVQERPGRVNR
jgi:hypothetical protein